MSTHNLLIELGTEELPPKALKRLSEAFTQGVVERLQKAELPFAEVTSYATPRRLAMLITDLSSCQPERLIERKGPAVKAAYDSAGNPTKAALGFARSCAVELSELDTVESNKGSWLTYRSRQAGEQTSLLLPDMIRESLERLPIPKRMRWSDLRSEFVRPVHWLVILFGDEVIDTEILSVRSGRATHGHRFHHPKTLTIRSPTSYADQLQNGAFVVPGFSERREIIRGQIESKASEINGSAVIDDNLLDEVTALVEWPVAILGSFDKGFLEVPQECLISTMSAHQKYFHLLDNKGQLLPNFITISNIESRKPEVVQQGNERVIRPRLTDAEFFWRQDLKQPLTAQIDRLKGVLFKDQLGSLYDKSQRVMILASHIAGQIGSEPSLASRAAELAKCDLMSEMVNEFPELQGTMGRYYALHDGEDPEVAAAIGEHYRPRFAGDETPSTSTGQALSIAERIDTLCAIFGIGQRPTGDKDPFALRRAALGILRIITEGGLELDLAVLIDKAVAGLNDSGTKVADGTAAEVYTFIIERLRNISLDEGIAADIFDAVATCRPTRPLDFIRRIAAVDAFLNLPEADSLATANKRIHNLLKKAETAIAEREDTALLNDPAEISLASGIDRVASAVVPLIDSNDYTGALKLMATLREQVDTFFDDVMIMVDDPNLRASRLALLKRLQGLFLQVADISRLQRG